MQQGNKYTLINSMPAHRIRGSLLAVVFIFSALLPALGQYGPVPLDTFDFNNQKIIIYNNHSWSYVSESHVYQVDTSTSVFDSFWDNNQIFAYLNKKSPYPDYTEIELLKPGSNFTIPVYGRIWGGFKKGHSGIDIELKKGDPVKAIFDGKVRYAKYNNGGYGYLVIIRHFNGLETYYSHLSKIWVAADQYVKSGDVIGLGGATGRAYGNHLHFEVRYLDKAFDPLSFIDFEGQKLSITRLIIDKNSMQYYAGNNTVGHTDYTPRPDTSNNNQTAVNTNPAEADPVYHKVSKGETLYSLARKYGTSVKAICELNNITPSTTLKIGRRLRIK